MFRALFFLTITSIFSLPSRAQSSPSYLDIVIDEVMADPTPIVALPDAEYIELKNISDHVIDLMGCKLASASKESSPFPDLYVPAGGFVILTSTSHAQLLRPYGTVLPVVSFPAITNNGATLSILAPSGAIVHSISFNKSWYGNAVKESGGWSLEMIDTRHPCSGSLNWKASEDATGGSPGKTNSVNGSITDDSPPRLLRTVTIDSLTITAIFDKSMDNASCSNPSFFTLNNGLTVASAEPVPPMFTSVRLTLDQPMDTSLVYTLSVNGVKDCAGNEIGTFHNSKAGWAAHTYAGLIINEVLYNPAPYAFDYVEIFNNGNKIVDASKLYLATRDNTGHLKDPVTCSTDAYLLFPGEYLVVTRDLASLAAHYMVKDPIAVREHTSMPSFPDNEGTVVLLSQQGQVIDEVKYSDSWQFPLINNTQGVALERINPDRPTQDPSNWHSASSTAAYGTPSYQNSQFLQTISLQAMVSVAPGIFSPDNDGYNDITTISYSLEEPGYMANCLILDTYGNVVRHLVAAALAGSKGQWIWNGLDDKGQKLPIGIYIIFTEFYKLDGKKWHDKKTVTLATKI